MEHPVTRRQFVKGAAGAAALGVLASCARRVPELATAPAADAAAGAALGHGPALGVRCENLPDVWQKRLLALLSARLQERGLRPAVADAAKPRLILAVAGDLPADGFRLAEAGPAVRVAGGSPRGVLYGLGKFLRTSLYEGRFAPSLWRGSSAPQCPVRGIYFANHFHNWYCMASPAELARYTEDLALWGMNLNLAIYPFINLDGWDDPEAEPALERLRGILRGAKEWDLDICLGIGPTNLFKKSPAEIRAVPLPDPLHKHGNAGVNICPSLPAGHDYMIQTYRVLFQRLVDTPVDYLCLWPYDEGGCACDKCKPWGANGYLRCSKELVALARQFMPRVKIILSTWTFDTPPEGEWAALSSAMDKDPSWVDFILADAHDDYPRYPLDVGVPGNKPLLNFPEISMWGNWPWGGWGAHPLPQRFRRLWNQIKHVCKGGYAYSEGIYEDMNKATVLQFYWNRDTPAEDTLREYIDYEFSPAVRDQTLRMVRLLESAASAPAKEHDAGAAQQAFDLAEAIQRRLPAWAGQSWRWEILYLRALLDRERYAGGGAETPAAQAALQRLLEIYHAPDQTSDPHHEWVRPPLKRKR